MHQRTNFIGLAAAAGFLFTIALLAHGCSPKHGDILVAKVGSEPITIADYEKLYEKSSGSRDQARSTSMEDREKFLGLMTNFRLKLADAYRQGLDKSPEVRDEIAQYKGSLAASFLTDREVTSPGVRKMFQMRKEEIRAHHILLNLPAGGDTADAYQKAREIIAQLKAGANFDTLALEHSQDPSVKQNNGDLYYFTGGQMVPAFEDAVYAMKMGEISPTPIRTQYGLHIVRVVDRKPAPGEVQCSHIMIRFDKQDPAPEDTAKAYAQIKAIQDSINMGVDFAELAIRNSGDPGSAQRGGDLGWFTRRRWIQSFDEVAVTMKKGEISPVVRTIYGYHLIKCTDTRPPKTFDEARKDIQQVYQQVRFQEDQKNFMTKLKNQVEFSMNESAVESFLTSLDSTKTTRDTAWADTITPEIGNSAMFSFGTHTVSVDSVIGLIKGRQDLSNTSLRASGMRPAIDKIAEQLVFEVRAETMERDYPEFKAIMAEYVDGILLYQIEQERVWNRVVVTDSALRTYFDANRDKFMYPDRVDYTALRIVNDSLAQLIHKQLQQGKTLEQIAAEDSARMRTPSSFQTIFGRGSSQVTSQSQKVLRAVAADMKGDPNLRVQLIAHPDTTRNKSQNLRLATRRLDALKAELMKKHKIADSRITLVPRPASKPAVSDEEKGRMNSVVDVVLSGRRANIIGGAQTEIIPVTKDELTLMADSLTLGAHSRPFGHQNAFVIVRLNKRDPLRHKTFEEAGTEVSSAFQEYESKRLEKEWLDGLRRQYPVVEYKEALKDAFAFPQ